MSDVEYEEDLVINDDEENENVVIKEDKPVTPAKKPRKQRVLSEEAKIKMKENLQKANKSRLTKIRAEKEVKLEKELEKVKTYNKQNKPKSEEKGESEVKDIEEAETPDDKPVKKTHNKKESVKKKKKQKIILQVDSDSDSSEDEAIIIKTRRGKKSKKIVEEKPLEQEIVKPQLQRTEPTYEDLYNRHLDKLVDNMRNRNACR